MDALPAGGRIAMMQSGYQIDFNPGKGIGDKDKAVWRIAWTPEAICTSAK